MTTLNIWVDYKVPSLPTSSWVFCILDPPSPKMTALGIYILPFYLFICMQTNNSIFEKFFYEQKE